MTNGVENYLDEVVYIAKSAGEEILRLYQSGEYGIQSKTDATPVTDADYAAHHLIVDRLTKLDASIPILSEEGPNIPFSERSKWQRYWLVDPLDGTREFIKGSSEFTVNIALIDNHCPILGVVHVPITDHCYFACSGVGAFKLEDEKEKVVLQFKPWRAGQISVLVSRRHGLEDFYKLLSRLGDYDVKRVSSSLKFALIAEGKADFHPRFGPTCEWDTAAGQCVVEQAGGAVVDSSWKPLQYNTKDSLVNPDFFVIGDASHLLPELKKIL